MSDATAVLVRAESTLESFQSRLLPKRRAVQHELVGRRDRMSKLATKMVVDGDALSLVEQCAEVLKMLIDRLAEGGVRELEAMLTYGVSTIFADRDYSVRIEVKDRGKDKSAVIWLVDNREDLSEPIETKLYDGNGGGLASVASLLLKVFLICKFKRRRFIFADEPMSNLSTNFVEGFRTFLRLLVDELNFVVLMITHDARFMPEADRVYEVNAGVVTEVKRG